MNLNVASPTITGSVNADSRELIAVSVMFSATSPPARWLSRFAVMPPGAATSSIMPTASAPWRSNARTRPKQTTGSTTSWQANATAVAFGYFSTRLKSATVNVRPRPNITSARATGMKIVNTVEDMAAFLSGQALIALTAPPCR